MKKRMTLLALILSACGPYTNVPARLHVVQTDPSQPLVAEVQYKVDATGKVEAIIRNPKLTIEGEAGSVGATFDTMRIEYVNAPSFLNPKEVTMAATLRVESSHNLTTDEKGVSTIIKGKGTTELPVINGRIVELGNPRSAQGSIGSPIHAKVTLGGIDDAGLPVSLEVGVPINFIVFNG